MRLVHALLWSLGLAAASAGLTLLAVYVLAIPLLVPHPLGSGVATPVPLWLPSAYSAAAGLLGLLALPRLSRPHTAAWGVGALMALGALLLPTDPGSRVALAVLLALPLVPLPLVRRSA